jgi:hypothetical protein
VESSNTSLRDFTLQFFKNLNCEVSFENDILLVKNVPANFEKEFGKRAPYHLVFERALLNEQTELVSAGSSLLQVMAHYLENLGQTSILKMNFEMNPQEILQRVFQFNNCTISSVSVSEKYVGFIRFTFVTTLQYLNKREQLTNEFFVSDGKIVDFDIKKYKLTEGKSEDIHIKNVKNEYELAKEAVKKAIQKKIISTSEDMKIKLEKEVLRIKAHYANRTKEMDDDFLKVKNQIASAENEYSKAKDNSKAKIKQKIEKLRAELPKLENKELREKIISEEKFFINDEIHKHSLSVDTKLFNTSIIYYPRFIWSAALQNSAILKRVSFECEPLQQQVSEIHCDSCSNSIRKISLCSGGHVSCDSCLRKCFDCGKEFCLRCLQSSCSVCGKKMCKSCTQKCGDCQKSVCKNHLNKNSISGKYVCTHCSIRCPKCSSVVNQRNIKKCPKCGREQCEKCSRSEYIRTRGQSSCSNCTKF